MSESERLLADYARRDAGLPPGRYSPAYPAHLFIRHPVEPALVQMLLALGAPRDRLAGLDLAPEVLASGA